MSIYEFSAEALDGAPVQLSEHRGKVVLIVNTASKCGFTPQYKGLEALYRKFKERGLVVLGFPCNQFGRQEPGDSDEIAAFCAVNYGVTFPLMGKIEVNGPRTHPLYAYLKTRRKGLLGSGGIKWNFTKFLVDRNGEAAARFGPLATPQSIQPAVEALL